MKNFIAALLFLALMPAWAEDSCPQLEKQFRPEIASSSDAYNMACCLALKKQNEAAFSMLNLALERGFKNTQHMRADSDLLALHNDPRWADLLKRSAEVEKTYLSQINRELKEIYEADQNDRRSDNIDWNVVGLRDQQRRQRVFDIVAQQSLKHSDDYYHAAMVFQHGEKPEDYKRAMDWSVQAVEHNPVNQRARWLACAAEDRYLMSLGKPQIWGTQYKRPKDGVWTMEPFDRSQKTDQDRMAQGVPILEKSQARLDEMNRALK